MSLLGSAMCFALCNDACHVTNMFICIKMRKTHICTVSLPNVLTLGETSPAGRSGHVTLLRKLVLRQKSQHSAPI